MAPLLKLTDKTWIEAWTEGRMGRGKEKDGLMAYGRSNIARELGTPHRHRSLAIT